jgi:LysM repeat protein
MNKLALWLAVAALTAACDRDGRAFREERTGRLYQTAMAEYRAGRMNEAVSGFEKVVRKDPLNSSARFQLASLQQDVRKDYLAAFCNFREYLLQAPESDKAGLAGDRMKMCERELAKVLAEKYALTDESAKEKLLRPYETELKKRDGRIAGLEKSLAEALRKNRLLADERDRLVNAVKSIGADEKLEKVSLKDVKTLLEEEEAEELSASTDTSDIASIKNEGEAEKELASSLLPEQTESAKASRRKKSADGGDSAQRPSVYKVQEGDTLYKIAVRFYGRTSAWREIRDANKALISTDGRVKTGDEIKLP